MSEEHSFQTEDGCAVMQNPETGAFYFCVVVHTRWANPGDLEAIQNKMLAAARAIESSYWPDDVPVQQKTNLLNGTGFPLGPEHNLN